MADRRLKGKNIIITGASSGVGAEIARLCAQQGANLVLLARRIDKLIALKEELQHHFQVDVIACQLDVSNTTEIEEVFQEVFKQIDRVDVLVNNAGFGIFREAHEAEVKEIKEMFAVNVIGLLACTKMVLPKMIATRSGHIINIASQAGKMATPKSSVYAATKHAVLGYTNSLRMEMVRSNVYVTAVNPGPIATDFFTVADQSGTYVKNVGKYMLQPHDVAKKIVNSMLTQTREINLPRWMNIGSVFYTLFPQLVERLGKKAFFKK
ncbi:SDR family oxidoreductase [Bacillus aquiflavi]|uniref:SDR family oxidoreductase n=1 Tax=Bacillus aquiflavi TaxID=2672567 RepID=A0A6B3VWC5_9BACI|nr:SDR family oxidoreductase [Bacillus aquiflavi]MBA4538201.1 SDR family oxidoreductase [Bacillus aquiflavi]NEY82520.1 SDR family oxidoreductase [Bacillus aquiflavi]UAC47162.1 SDR family oxidoreductase [Bacillus aquiflavi]